MEPPPLPTGGDGTPLLVTADDFGLTVGTSRAIVDAHRRGVVTATSVLAVAPGTEASLPLLDEVPALAAGVHLALVGEDPPLLSAREIPSLVGRSGRLASSWRSFAPRVLAGRVDPDDVRRELGAQVELVGAARSLAHLDSHQHVHLLGPIAEVVVELALDHGIGRVRVPRPSRSGPRAAAIGVLAARLDRRVADAGLARTQRFAGLDEAGAWDEARLLDCLERLGAGGGSVEINAHPGAASDVDRDRYRWGYQWADEHQALTGDGVRRAVEAHGFVLTGVLDRAPGPTRRTRAAGTRGGRLHP